MVLVIVAIMAAALVIGAVVVYRLTRSNDAVESFRRQIDALSPEARRSVVDQVNKIDDGATGAPAADVVDAETPETPETPDKPDDIHGT